LQDEDLTTEYRNAGRATAEARFSISNGLLILILMLTAISSLFVIQQVVLPHIDKRMQFERDTLAGNMQPPYQYRILKPLIAGAIQSVVSPVIQSRRIRHLFAYSAIAIITFFTVYYLFYIYLRNYFSDKTSTMGLLLLQAVIPLAVTGFYMIDDFMTLLFFILGFLIFLHDKDRYLPLLIAISAFNREQTVFLIIFYIIFKYSQGRLLHRKSILVILTSTLSFLIVYAGIRVYFGFRPSEYSIPLQVARNLEPGNLFGKIIPLWLAEVAGFFILSVFSFRKANRFFRISFLLLGLYLFLFFLKGNLWEMAKFLPAYIILIPMSLMILTGEYKSGLEVKRGHIE